MNPRIRKWAPLFVVAVIWLVIATKFWWELTQ
jgi:hypothetical protein